MYLYCFAIIKHHAGILSYPENCFIKLIFLHYIVIDNNTRNHNLQTPDGFYTVYYITHTNRSQFKDSAVFGFVKSVLRIIPLIIFIL